MNDASEVLGVIFECLHKSYTSQADWHAKSHESNSIGSWDCASDFCIAHCLFGMDVYERMNCHSCGLESRRLKYTSFFHNINASSLRTAKVSCFPYVESHAYYSRVPLFSGWTGPVYAPQLFSSLMVKNFKLRTLGLPCVITLQNVLVQNNPYFCPTWHWLPCWHWDPWSRN